MTIIKAYFDFVQKNLQDTLYRQENQVAQAAQLVSEACLNGGRFYVFGSGHSHMVAEELYIRAGGLAYVQAVLPGELMLHEMANKSTFIERLDGYATGLLKLYKFTDKDVMMIISNSGRNNVPVEMAMAVHDKGGKVIAITSLAHSRSVTSRHSSGKRLFEVADVVLDNGAPIGDAGFTIPGLDTPMGATSNALGIILAQTLVCQVVDNLVQAGHTPPIFRSSNVDGADDYNNRLFEQYYSYYKNTQDEENR